MAKGHRHTNHRDTKSVASLLADSEPIVRPAPLLRPSRLEAIARRSRERTAPPLSDVEDRRRYTPQVRWPRKLGGETAKLTLKHPRPTAGRRNAWLPRFDAPRDVIICIRRKIRREVMFALRKTGRGARSKKRFTAWSKIRC